MAYLIYNISDRAADEFPLYFFDCNVWIAQLQAGPRKRLEPYKTFFEAVINLHGLKDIKAAKKVRNFPKIIVTTLLLSEIFNAYMRQVAMKVYYTLEYTKTNAAPSEDEILRYISKIDYKKTYRKTEDFQNQLMRLKSNFLAYEDYIVFHDDDLNDLQPKTVVSSIGNTSDFNDYFYYFSFIDKNIPVVTDDGDFLFQDIHIFTANSTLLKAAI